MPKRLARITQAEIQRVIRARKKEGVATVELQIGPAPCSRSTTVASPLPSTRLRFSFAKGPARWGAVV
jgi:hypothetical protein